MKHEIPSDRPSKSQIHLEKLEPQKSAESIT